MAFLDFEQEKRSFRKFYDKNLRDFEQVIAAYVEKLEKLVADIPTVEVTKIEGRVKEREECIAKFRRKYQNRLESDDVPYKIKHYISDLLGVRIVCLYEDHIPLIAELIRRHFTIIDETDRISAVERTEASFGYKSLHMDVMPGNGMDDLSRILPVEVQIRSLIQDAWSVLDHKIKYKKSIPQELKRRINVLSALFELADREFKEIRNATIELIQQETEEAAETEESTEATRGKTVNAFNFLRIAEHFFKDVQFVDYKVDNFVQDILKLDKGFQRSDLHTSLTDHLKTVREYRNEYMKEYPESSFSPYTVIRHCLFLYRPETFGRLLSKGPRNRFEAWLKSSGTDRS